jgi:hypothetical protein
MISFDPSPKLLNGDGKLQNKQIETKNGFRLFWIFPKMDSYSISNESNGRARVKHDKITRF